MDLATQISQLPGSRSGELAEILRSVSGNPEDIRAIATRWRSAAGTVSEQTGRVTTAVNDVDTAWEGASADAFDGYMGKYDKAGTALHDVLEDSAASSTRRPGRWRRPSRRSPRSATAWSSTPTATATTATPSPPRSATRSTPPRRTRRRPTPPSPPP
ncbi:WXG100 family type VII secretion target [Nonomuraea ferruginea]